MVLFGSRPAKTSQSDFESVEVLLPLAPPSGAAILSLERLLGDHGSATLEAEVGEMSFRDGEHNTDNNRLVLDQNRE